MSRTVITEAQVIDCISDDSRAVSRFITALLYIFLLCFPFLFGGVHSAAWLTASAFILIIFSIFLSQAGAPAVIWRKGVPGRLISVTMLAVFSWSVTQFLLLPLIELPRSSLTGARYLDMRSSLEALLYLAFIFSSYFVFRFWLSRGVNIRSFFTFLASAGFLISLIALAHWFYDNGKLFWLFEPETAGTSDRARWPFVNPNHLAHFLVPLFFIQAASALNAWENLRGRLTEDLYVKAKPLGRALSGKTFQKLFTRTTIFSVLSLASAVAIIATLSRGGITALIAGLFIFAAVGRNRKSNGPVANPAVASSPHRRERSRKRFLEFLSHLGKYSAIFKTLLFMAAAGSAFFMLQGEGSERLLDRIDYGLMHTSKDLRFQLYRDTLPMFRDHLFAGVGPGLWEKHYPAYMNVQVTGIKPGYLHSDPYQFAVELGAPATLLVLTIIMLILIHLVRRIKILQKEQRDMALFASASLAGLAAVILASLFDFPFRIPAIPIYFFALLSALINICEKDSPPQRAETL